VIDHVQIVHVPVSDQDRARAFYADTLGLTVIADMEMGPHGRWLQVGPEGAQTSLALVPGDASLTAGSLRGTVLQTTDIDATVEQLREHGVEFPHGIEDMPWARTARFADPDGNELVLQTPAPRGGG
jgi:predicted enzyme related to lactoylglutathione lyase